MKKALAILLALALVAGAVYAEDAAYTLSGSASLVWGIDLNTQNHGFTNSASATLTFPLTHDGDKKSGDPITGEISISDFVMSITNGAFDGDNYNGSVTAKILLPSNMFIQIASAPSQKFNNAKPLSSFYADAGSTSSTSVSPAIAPNAGGFAFGMTGDFNFALKVNSSNKHTDATGDNSYGVALDVGYKFGDMGDVKVNTLFGNFNSMLIAAGLGLNLKPFEGFTAFVGADFQTVSGANDLDARVTLGYKMADVFSFDFATYLGMPGFTFNDIDLMVRLGLLAVENLTFKVGVDVWNLPAATNNILVASEIAYKVMMGEANYVKPYANVAYSMVNPGLYLKTGVEMALIPLTKFTLNYTGGKFNYDDVALSNTLGADKGVLTFTTKITY